MAWIESHQELGQHPKTKKAARLLGVSRPAIVGHLHYLWWWALSYAHDGDLSGFEAADIADAALWDGDPDALINALIACALPGEAGFLERTEDGRLLIHDWREYTGRLVDQREKAKARTKAWREQKAADRPVSIPNADATPLKEDVTHNERIRYASTVPNPTVPYQTLTPAVAIAPAGDAPAPAEPVAVAAEPEPVKTRPAPKPERDPKGPAAFQAFYDAYPKHEARQDALAAWLKLKPDGDLCAAIMAGVGAWQASGRWTDPKYIPLPATFLNGRRWEDEPAPAVPAAPPRASPNGNGHRPGPLSTLEKIRLKLGENGNDGGAGPVEAVYSVAPSRQRPDRVDPGLLARPG